MILRFGIFLEFARKPVEPPTYPRSKPLNIETYKVSRDEKGHFKKA